MTKTAHNSKYHYRHLDPIPTAEELAEFYSHDYYDFAGSTSERAPDLQRLLSHEKEAAEEIEWLSSTVWRDVNDVFSGYLRPKCPILDVGCGTGDFAKFLQTNNWEMTGIEPANLAAANARDLTGMKVFRNLRQLKFDWYAPIGYAAITLMNVLEHVRDPIKLLLELKEMLHPCGLIAIRVPNDFSTLQGAALELGIDSWWISRPDHINYFSFYSLSLILEDLGFSVIEQMSDFPMELFLLLGHDYTASPAVGKWCHTKRRELELALPTSVRQELYRDLAKRGVGRNCLIIASLEDMT